MANRMAEPGSPVTALHGLAAAVSEAAVACALRIAANGNAAWCRMIRRQPRFKPREAPSWRRMAVVTIALAVLAFHALDPLVGEHRPDTASTGFRISACITDFGKSGGYITLSALVVLFLLGLDWNRLKRAQRRLAAAWLAVAWFFLVAIAGSGLIAAGLKLLIGRARPALYHCEGLLSFHSMAFQAVHASFPSGHSTTVGAFCAAVALLFPRMRLAMVVAAFWFGFSRLMVGVHYASDVIAGLALGVWFSYWCAWKLAAAGVLFSFDDRGWPVTRRGFRLTGLSLHRRMCQLCQRLEAVFRRGGVRAVRSGRG